MYAYSNRVQISTVDQRYGQNRSSTFQGTAALGDIVHWNKGRGCKLWEKGSMCAAGSKAVPKYRRASKARLNPLLGHNTASALLLVIELMSSLERKNVFLALGALSGETYIQKTMRANIHLLTYL